uniref:Uncharacterized protein n=1 Tax=Culex tarsalis TaxID=7177 RepID=A0A1Q3FWZ1_CULTA
MATASSSSAAAAGPLPASDADASKQPSHSNSIRSNTKATVHINGVAVDHFQQNSDVDEVEGTAAASACQNSDIHGFISYSSDSSMIELNLKFRKCACNENIINISKENLQQQQKVEEGQHRTTTATSATFGKEGNSKKLLQLNKDNLNSLVSKLNDTNSSSSSCTKCRLTLDINNILNQIVSDRQVKCETKLAIDREALPGDGDDGEEPCNGRTLKVGSPSKAASWSPSPLSASPSPRSIAAAAALDPNRLQRRHSENVERRSIGIQHGLRPAQRKKQLRRGKTQVEEIIIISDEFRRQSLSDQKIKVSRGSKQLISKSMESIDDKPTATGGKTVGVHLEEDTLTVVLDSAKTKSKSVDDISLGSNHNEEEFGPPTPLATAATAATNSVELVFISDEFVQRKTKASSDVIVVVDANRKSSSKRRKSSSAGAASTKNQLVIITDDDEDRKKPSKDVRIVRTAKDARRKTTISSSNSFLTYEEPFSPETLESKDIGAMFAEATSEIAAAAATAK